MKLNYRSLLAVVISASLAIPGAAMADRRGDGDRGHRYEHDHGYRYQPRYQYGHRGERHDYRVYRDRPVTRYYRDDDDNELLLGLVVGGILGYAINNAQQGSAGYGRYYPAPRAYDNAYDPTETYSDGTCLQEREYTTVVEVGGRNVDAYGTACLQPDGSWKRGPAQMVSY
jgi:hypothetical protein